jgi:hypothetical protein
LCFTFTNFYLSAEDNTPHIIVKRWDVSVWDHIPYTQKVKILFPKEYQNAGRIRIITENETYEYETYYVKSILYVDDNSSVHDITTIPEDVKLTENGIELGISKPNSKLGIYTTDGKIVMYDTLQPGKHSISLSHFVPGIYIIKLNNESFKILI